MGLRAIAYVSGIIVLGIVLGSQFFVSKPHFLAADISEAFSSSLSEEARELRKENEDLKNKLFALQHNVALSQDTFVSAKVFSLYPFNTKNRIFIDRGARDGISPSSLVLYSERVLMGTVREAREEVSEVITVFDPEFSLPVRIGSSEVDALFKGGVTPRVTLIDKSKSIASGDLILSASKDTAYGLTVGSVREVREDASGAFYEAVVSLPYNLNDARTVLVRR